jgi:hypothetical protein
MVESLVEKVCAIPESRVTKVERAYALSVEMQHPALAISHDNEVPTISDMARCLMVGHYPTDADYIDRIGIWNQLAKGRSPEEIIASKSKWQGVKFGLIYEYKSSDLDGQVVYVGFTISPLKHRMGAHKGSRRSSGSDRFDKALQSGLTTICSVVGIGTREDESRRMAARVVQGHPILNVRFNPVPGLDFFVSDGGKNVVLFLGEATEKVWNKKSMTMSTKPLSSKEQLRLPRTLCTHHTRNCHRMLLDHSEPHLAYQGGNRSVVISQMMKERRSNWLYDMQLSRFTNMRLVELPCSACGTLGVVLEKNVRKRPLRHAFSECCRLR